MKSKYYLALFLTGVLPVLGLTGVYFWTVLNQPAPAAKGAPAHPAAQLSLMKTQVESMASAMANSIRSVNHDVPGLSAHNSEADLTTFKGTHNGVSGVAVISVNGRMERMVPSSPPLIADPAYGSSEEFQKAAAKVKENGGQPYLFYTQQMGFPAFVFAVSVSPREVAEAVVGLSNFFRDVNPANGDMFFLEAGSGLILYDTDPSKSGANFNPNQEPWLAKVQTDLANGEGGSAFNPGALSAVYAYAGFGKFGIVHLIPPALLQAAAPAAGRAGNPLDNPAELIQTPMSLAAIVCLGWIFIVGSLFWGMILGPLRRATTAVLNAANGNAILTAETVRRFGKDEAGQVVQAASALMQKVDEEKQKAGQEMQEASKRARAEVEAKSRDAADQVATAQQQARAAQAELGEKNQQLGDKLKELDALKGMSEGLRNQAEQAKTEGARLKSQLSTADAVQEDFKKKLAEAQGKLSEMESKMLTALAASSAIQVSQVRAAAIRTMAEELKTTLGIIKGYVSSALGTTQGGINEKQQEFLGMVINRSARLEKFINDLLDIYQVEIEQAEAKHEEVNLASEIEGLAFNFQAQAEVKNIKIKVEAKPGLPKVPVVRRRFNQLWNILYLQTIKDAPRGSTIPITLEPIGDSVKVTLQDPGLNVAAESLPKLFDEFYDPKHTASPQLAGTGLKFALVKTILAAHGGGAVAEKGEPGTKMILTFATQVKKPGAAGQAHEIPAAPSAAPKAPVAPLRPGLPPLRPSGSDAPAGLGARPPLPTAPGLAGPAAAAPARPSVGVPPPPPGTGVKPPAPPLGAPKSPMSPGLLDSLISKVPPVTAPGLRPAPGGSSVPGTPSLGGTPLPGGTPGAPPVPPTVKPSLPVSSVPGVTAAPLPPKEGAAPKPQSLTPPAGSPIPPQPPRPGVPPVTPVPGMTPPNPPASPKPLMPGTPLPVGTPALGGTPSVGIPKPAVPPVPGMAASPPAPPGPGVKPTVPGIPPAGAPPMAPKPLGAPMPRPAAPPMPGAPSLGGSAAPGIPKPSIPASPVMPANHNLPGMAAPGAPSKPAAPVMPPTVPRLVPTNVKPTTPPPGILDLDNMDGMKLDAGTPKPPPPMPGVPPMAAPGAPRPTVPPAGGMKPPMPGMPPIPGGGRPIVKDLNKEGEGDLIE